MLVMCCKMRLISVIFIHCDGTHFFEVINVTTFFRLIPMHPQLCCLILQKFLLPRKLCSILPDKEFRIYLQIFDKYCPDGLVFDEASTAFAKCSFPFSVDCKGRPELQPAQPTKLCPRQNGYFAHEDPSVNGNFMAFATYNFLL